MKRNQEEALKKLEAAFLACKRAGVALVGNEDGIAAAPLSSELNAARDASDAVRAVVNDPDTRDVKTYGCYWDSGSA